MSHWILSGYIDIPMEDLDAVLRELPNHIDLTRAEDGCLVFEVVQDRLLPTRFDVYEAFASQEAFDRHQARVRSSKWGRLTQNATRQYTIAQEDP